jgi:two-component system OmpR family sensor kinase
MARIEAESARMGILVEELLVLAQLDQEPVARRMAVDLRELAQHAVDDGRVIAPDREITLTVDRPLVVLGEPHQLGQLLANLMRNAVIHTPAGTPVEVALRRDGAQAVVEVRDHGPGLAPDAVERVFERFWRTEGGRRRGPAGAGLGLAIVRAIVTAHGGSATAENARGGGARFTIKLPLSADPTGPTVDAGEGVSGDSQLSPGRRSDRSQTVSNR